MINLEIELCDILMDAKMQNIDGNNKEECRNFLLKEYLNDKFDSILHLNGMLNDLDIKEVNMKTLYKLAGRDNGVTFDELIEKYTLLLNDSRGAIPWLKYMYELGIKKKINRDQMLIFIDLANNDGILQDLFLSDILDLGKDENKFISHCKMMIKMINKTIKEGQKEE